MFRKCERPVKRDWSKTRIGKIAEPLADELYNLLKDRFIAYFNANPLADPRDVGIVTSEVVFQIALDSGALKAYDNRYMNNIIAARKKEKKRNIV